MKHQRLTFHIPDPFDPSATARLKNMGAINGAGEVSETVMPAFARIFTALFIDDICAFYDDKNDLQTVFSLFDELFAKEAYHHMYLLLSIQYDYIRKPLPDPVWWLAGDAAAIKAFMHCFMPMAKDFMSSDIFSDADSGEE